LGACFICTGDHLLGFPHRLCHLQGSSSWGAGVDIPDLWGKALIHEPLSPSPNY